MKNFLIKHVGQVLTATVARPKALNALNVEVMEELDRLIQDFYDNAEIRGLILTGDGEKAFVAGADIKELAILTREEALELAKKGQSLYKKIEDCPKPILAAVNGFALGGGCELAMACHIRIATENAKFGQPEINLGIIPGYGGTQRLAQLVGRGKALELMLTGDLISAQEAKELGLVNHVVSTRDELMALANSMMNKIVSKSPIAIANTIKSVNAGFGQANAGYTAEAENFAACAATDDFKEGTTAFIEKRSPNFRGK
jgi:enoyl-CoA hydratase